MTSIGKCRLNLINLRASFMGQKASSQLGTVIGSKKAGVQIFDFKETCGRALR